MKFEAGTMEAAFINVPRIYLDGKDITNQCNRFDSDEGWADVYEWEVEEKRFRVVTIGGNPTSSMVRLFGKITSDPPLPELERTVTAVRAAVNHFEDEKKEVSEVFSRIETLVNAVAVIPSNDAVVRIHELLRQMNGTT